MAWSITCAASEPGSPDTHWPFRLRCSHAPGSSPTLSRATRTAVMKPCLSHSLTCVYQMSSLCAGTMDAPSHRRESLRSVTRTRHLGGESCALLIVASLVPAISNPNASLLVDPGLFRTASNETKSVWPDK